ncbi:MAG: hypothetical protein ACYDB2_02365 [Acidimicrobiales bacterium]
MKSIVREIVVVGLLFSLAPVCAVASGAATTTYHLAIVGAATWNEGSAVCNVVFARQSTKKLTRIMEKEVKNQRGATVSQMSGNVREVAGPTSTARNCPYQTTSGVGTGTVIPRTARLVKGVAKFSSLYASSSGSYTISFTFRNLNTNGLNIQFVDLSSASPTTGTATSTGT